MYSPLNRPSLFGVILVCSIVAGDVGFADEPTTIMTYNIRYLNSSDGEDIWANRREAVIETIRTADIVGLQEVVLAQYQSIQKGTSEWSWYGVGRDDGKQAGEFAPIGYRSDRFKSINHGTLWLSETPDAPGSRGWDAALPRTVTWMLLEKKSDAARLLVLNTHFDHRGESAREQSGKLIAARIDVMAKDVPVIVMGDFNAKPNSKPLTGAMSGSVVSLKDSREIAAEPTTGPTGTWNGFKAIDLGIRIDHILVSDRVRVISHEVLDPKTKSGRFASDHLPVVAKVSF